MNNLENFSLLSLKEKEQETLSRLSKNTFSESLLLLMKFVDEQTPLETSIQINLFIALLVKVLSQKSQKEEVIRNQIDSLKILLDKEKDNPVNIMIDNLKKLVKEF